MYVEEYFLFFSLSEAVDILLELRECSEWDSFYPQEKKPAIAIVVLAFVLYFPEEKDMKTFESNAQWFETVFFDSEYFS